jgi:hypothetical protein
LYYVYFGLLNLGIGSALYQWGCPRQIKKHGDWEDYVRIDGPAMTNSNIAALGSLVGRDHQTDLQISGANWPDLKIDYLRQHYAMLSAEAKYLRLAVAYFFLSGLALLSIPSLMTAFKILVLFIRT